MSGRPKIFDENDVVRKASGIFWQKGYEGSSSEVLLKAMKMGKGSFYLHFKGGKKELYQRSLELFCTEAMGNFYSGLSQEPDKIDFLKRFLLSLSDAPAEETQKGCFLGNVIVEMSNCDIKTKDQAGALLQKLEAAFAEIIAEAQSSGRLKTKIDAILLAKYLINLRNGICITARTEKQPNVLKEMIELSLEILK